METIKYINLADMFMDLTEFMVEPDKKENVEKIEQYKKDLVIRPFLFSEQKDYVVDKTLYDITVEEGDAVSFSGGLEISLTFNALLAYVVNIDYDIPDIYKMPAFYDVLWGSGIGDYILQFCEKDYERVRRRVEQAFSYYNLKELLDIVSRMDTTSVSGLTEAFKNFTTAGSTEFIKTLADFEAYKDPRLVQIKEGVDNAAYEAAKAVGKATEKTRAEASKQEEDVMEVKNTNRIVRSVIGKK